MRHPNLLLSLLQSLASSLLAVLAEISIFETVGWYLAVAGTAAAVGRRGASPTARQLNFDGGSGRFGCCALVRSPQDTAAQSSRSSFGWRFSVENRLVEKNIDRKIKSDS